MRDETRNALDRAAKAEIRLQRVFVQQERYPEDAPDTEGLRAARMEALSATTVCEIAMRREYGASFTDEKVGRDILITALRMSIAENERIICG